MPGHIQHKKEDDGNVAKSLKDSTRVVTLLWCKQCTFKTLLSFGH